MVRRVPVLLAAFLAVTGADAARRSQFVELPQTAAVPSARPGDAPQGEAAVPIGRPPVPEARPDTPQDMPGATPQTAPEPEPRPDPPTDAAPAPVPPQSEDRPEKPSLPTPPDKEGVPADKGEPAASPGERPAAPPEAGKPEDKPAEAPAAPTYLPDPRSPVRAQDPPPAEEIACRTRLAELGVAFEVRPEEHDPAGCALPYPLSVRRLGSKVAIEPAALMNCAMAKAAARFVRDVVQPAAQAAYGEDVAAIAQASAYVCRPRNGTTKLSEHAFGNALDIAAFVLSKGTRVDVGTTSDDKADAFQAQVRKAACGPFKTVLGPGSDADHATHFHLDLAPRRNGGTFCQ